MHARALKVTLGAAEWSIWVPPFLNSEPGSNLLTSQGRMQGRRGPADSSVPGASWWCPPPRPPGFLQSSGPAAAFSQPTMALRLYGTRVDFTKANMAAILPGSPDP